MFLGEVPITQYETPGGQEFADTVLPYVKKTQHDHPGQPRHGELRRDVEKAYWWTEIIDAYCRILILAKQLGRVNYFTEQKTRELLDLKTKWGCTDARLGPGMENCDICANDIFRDSGSTPASNGARRSSRRPRWAPEARAKAARPLRCRRPTEPTSPLPSGGSRRHRSNGSLITGDRRTEPWSVMARR